VDTVLFVSIVLPGDDEDIECAGAVAIFGVGNTSGVPNVLRPYWEEYKAERRRYERLFQLCIETVIDLTALIVKQEGLGTPSDEDSLVRKVEDAGIIRSDLSDRILEAASTGFYRGDRIYLWKLLRW